MKIPPLFALVCVLYALQVLVVVTHALRHRVGFLPLGCLMGTLVVFMMLTDPLGPRLGSDFGIGLPIGSLTLFPNILMALLLVQVSDGVRPMLTLLVSLLGVYVLLYASSLYLWLWNAWAQAGLMTMTFAVPDSALLGLWPLLQSALSLVLDVAVMTALLGLFLYGLPNLPKGVIFGITLAAGLITDGIVYPLLGLNLERIVADLPGQVLGKVVVAALMTAPMVTHISRCAECAPRAAGAVPAT
jgi:hypothetical protein